MRAIVWTLTGQQRRLTVGRGLVAKRVRFPSDIPAHFSNLLKFSSSDQIPQSPKLLYALVPICDTFTLRVARTLQPFPASHSEKFQSSDHTLATNFPPIFATPQGESK